MAEQADWNAPRSYQSVLSIGAQCVTSMLLKQAGLKRFSGPFDWIFSNLRMVCDCVEDDFAALLDLRYLVPVPIAIRPTPDSCFADHRLFKNRYGLTSIFNHYDPLTPGGHAYLQRCVERFRTAMTSGQPQLLLAIVRRHQGGLFGFDRLCNVLERYPSIEALIFVSPETREPRSLDIWKQRGRHRLIHLHTPSQVSGVRFEQEEDDDFVVETLRRLILLG